MRYTAADIAAECGISVATFYNWMKAQKELRTIATQERENTTANGTKKTTFGEQTRIAFLNEAARRGKNVRQELDNGLSNAKSKENPCPSTELDNPFSNVRQELDKEKQALIDELKAQNEYLKKKLDEALNDNREYSQALVKMSANVVYLQSENKRLTDAQQKPNSIWERIKKKVKHNNE